VAIRTRHRKGNVVVKVYVDAAEAHQPLHSLQLTIRASAKKGSVIHDMNVGAEAY
jgi:hypothetical protein